MDSKATIEDNGQLSSRGTDTATSFSRSEIGDGHILSWGCGEFGQHGHGHSNNVRAEDSPMQHFYKKVTKDLSVTLGSSIQSLKTFACGASHTVVVTGSDQVYSWGNGNSGQLGCGDKDTHLIPQRVKLPTEDKVSSIQGIACGSRHSVLWLENGLCFSWGNNFYAQLAYDFRIENYKDNQANRQFLLQHLARKNICDEVLPHILRPIAHLKVTQVACGEKHSLFLYETGVVATCGCSSFGQLGSGNRAELVSPKALESPEGVASIACGANHSLAVTAGGKLYAWGFGRACGQRRDDVLRPMRITMRKSNVVTAAGGSAHSAALTANGIVYTWGGGTEGQLGHGSKVLYLRDPRRLSHDALPRVSQIACATGALYMWGKSSHVIPTLGEPTPSSQHPTPVLVPLGGHPVARVACGSWHTIAVVGRPEWQPLEEDSEEELDLKTLESKDATFSEPMELDEGRDAITEDANDNSRSVFQKLQQKDDIGSRVEPPTQCTNPVQRETTKLTLAEFYAPTPLPAISPPEEYSDEMDSELDDEKTMEEEVEPEEQVVLNSGETVSEALDYQGADDGGEKEDVFGGELDESDPVENSDPASVVVDLGDASEVERTKEDEVVVKEKPKLDKGDTSIRSNRHQSRPRGPNMVRSRTMPVVTRKPLRMAAASATTAFDWSEPPKASIEAEPARDRFAIDKHVSVQMNRKGNGSGDRVKGKKPIAQVGLPTQREEDVSFSRSKERNIMPQPPNFNRAKTYYGRMNQKRPEAEPKLSQFLSSLPPAPSQTSSAPTKLQPRRRLEKLGAPSDRSPIRSKPSLDLVPEMKGRIPGKPVFSSASSWRTRNPEEDIL